MRRRRVRTLRADVTRRRWRPPCAHAHSRDPAAASVSRHCAGPAPDARAPPPTPGSCRPRPRPPAPPLPSLLCWARVDGDGGGGMGEGAGRGGRYRGRSGCAPPTPPGPGCSPMGCPRPRPGWQPQLSPGCTEHWSCTLASRGGAGACWSASLWLVVTPPDTGLVTLGWGFDTSNAARPASGAAFVGKQAHMAPGAWKEWVRCGKSRVLIISSFLPPDW